MKTFSLPPGFRVELVASEPMIESPILMDFDPDGRLWVLEMLTFLPDTSGRDSREPLNRVSVLEDTNGDGRMDKKTVFADKLSMPRALKVLDHGVLIGEPPNLWLMKDTDGDLVADTKDLVVNTYGNPNGGIEHNANSLFWAMDNVMYSSEHVWDLRLANGKFEPLPALSRGQWQVSQDDAGRIYRNVNDSPLFVDYTPSRYFLRNPNGARTRGLYELLIEQTDAVVYPVRNNRGVNRGYRDPFFRADESSIVIQGASGPTIYRGDAYPKELHGNAFIPDSPTNLVHRMVVTDDGSGRLTAKNGYDARRVPGVVRRALPPGEPVRRPGRQPLRGRHVPRCRAGRRPVERIPHRLHQGERPGAAGRQGPHLARRVRERHCAASGGARAVEGDAAAAGPDVVEPEGLVARYRAAPAGGARRRLRRTRAEDAGRKRAGLADATARTVDARRPGRDRRRRRSGRRWRTAMVTSVRLRSGCRSDGSTVTRRSRRR